MPNVQVKVGAQSTWNLFKNRSVITGNKGAALLAKVVMEDVLIAILPQLELLMFQLQPTAPVLPQIWSDNGVFYANSQSFAIKALGIFERGLDEIAGLTIKSGSAEVVGSSVRRNLDQQVFIGNIQVKCTSEAALLGCSISCNGSNSGTRALTVGKIIAAGMRNCKTLTNQTLAVERRPRFWCVQ